MGEPAVPTPADRAETLKLAREIVDSVREDADLPEPFTGDPDDITANAVFRLAQDLVAASERLATVDSALDNWDWEGLARDARRGDFDSAADALATIARVDRARKERG